MGIEGSNADARPIDAESGERREGQVDHLDQPPRREERGNPFQGDMRTHMRDAKILVGEHHAGIGAAGEIGEHVGVPGIGMTREVDGLLRDRAGDDRLNVAGHCVAYGARDGRKG